MAAMAALCAGAMAAEPTSTASVAEQAAPATAPAATGPAAFAAALPAIEPAGPGTQPATQSVTQPTTRPATTMATTLPAAVGPLVVAVPGDGLILNFRDASIDAVLDQLSEVAGFTVVKPQPRLDGRITILSKQPVSPEEAIALLNTALSNNGYAAAQLGRILKIFPRDKARQANIPVRTGNDPRAIQATDEVITQIIPIRYVEAVQLKQDLSPLVAAGADLSVNAASNSLILTDTSVNIRRVVQIISALDQQLSEAVDVKVHPLKHASAASAAKLINDVFREDATSGNAAGGGRGAAGGGGRFGGGGFGGGGFGGGGFGGPGGFGGGAAGGGAGGQGATARRQPKVTAASDDRTNTVVVTGPTDVLKVVERVLDDLDADKSVDQSVFVYSVKNGQAANIAGVINSLFNGTAAPSGNRTNGQGQSGSSYQSPFGNFGGTSGNGGGRTGGGSGSTGFGAMGSGNTNRNSNNTVRPAGMPGLSNNALRTGAELSGQVNVVANTDTNSLVIMSNPKNFDRIQQILDELDRAVPQVLIKVLIAEVSHDNIHDLGAEFSAFNLRAGTNMLNQTPLGSKGGTDFGVTNVASGLTYRLIEQNLDLAIRALETSDKTDVLSRPYILASDNQTAQIMVGQEVPLVNRSQVTDAGNQINSYAYQDVGIILTVTPHINTDGLVILDVAPEISALTSQSIEIQPGVRIPVIARRAAQSRVAIKNGQTIIIGGLMEDRLNEHVDKVPLLGDIPLLGLLFQNKHTDKTKTELLIFLTPTVASTPDVLQRISKNEEKDIHATTQAVDPRAFAEQMKAMRRGSTQPAEQAE